MQIQQGVQGDAAFTAAYTYNRSPHASLGFLTSYKIFFSKKPDISNMIIFGSRAFVLNFSQERQPATRIGEIVHADLVGEISPTSSYKQKRYILIVMDNLSRYVIILLLKNKTETPSKLDACLREIQVRFQLETT